MFACNRCGQCTHISNDNFIEYISVSGTEKRYIDCDSGEVVEYGDIVHDDYGDSTYYCPHCDSDDIDTDSAMSEDLAKELRKNHTEELRKARIEAEMIRLKRAKKEAMAKTGWDI